MNTACDIFQLIAALDLDTVQRFTNYDKMTTIIRYRTPYIIKKQDPLLISFTLSNDISLRYVLDLLTLFVLSGCIDLVKEELSCF